MRISIHGLPILQGSFILKPWKYKYLHDSPKFSDEFFLVPSTASGFGFSKNPSKNADDYFVLSVEVFPSGQDRFNQTGVYGIAFVLSNQTFKPPKMFGPFYFIGDLATVGGSVLVILSLLVRIYAFRQKRRGQRADKVNNPFGHFHPNEEKASHGLKIRIPEGVAVQKADGLWCDDKRLKVKNAEFATVEQGGKVQANNFSQKTHWGVNEDVVTVRGKKKLQMPHRATWRERRTFAEVVFKGEGLRSDVITVETKDEGNG
ncbi:hypothetical protein HYC85_010031 [Camellia sinensis]|uniref:Uncharacterized protein n=1 Tax=Camellia sinensis TaxID=4442 RepID=A0A7J7HI70_CAMSI|nr:hypothetical protein HYC85_010031 [Camellia sinensis]